MKKHRNGFMIAICTAVCVITAFSFAACGGLAETKYNVIKSNEEYVLPTNPLTGAYIDEEIKLDGVFDEEFYEGKSWYESHKIMATNTRTATLKTTTYFAKHGVLLAVEVKEGYPISWHSARGTAYNSGIEFYFALGNDTSPLGNLYEIDLTAHGEFQMRQYNDKFTSGAYEYAEYSYADAPAYGISLEGGRISSGNCTGYAMELFLPYSLFGIDYRPDFVYINPGMITPLGSAGNARDTYYFGLEQSPSICGWAKVEAYKFDRNGLVCDKITVQSQGGTVTEKFGRSWCVSGDRITFNVVAEEGKTLASIRINNVEYKSNVIDGNVTVDCNGDIEIVAQFE